MGKFMNNDRLTDRVEIYLIVNGLQYNQWINTISKYMEWNSKELTQWKEEAKIDNDRFTTSKDSERNNEDYQNWLENKFSDKLNQYADQRNNNTNII